MENFSNIEKTDLLISAYLSGNCTLAEAEELMLWIKKSEENLEYFTQFKIAWLQAGQSDEKSIIEKWEHLQMRIEDRNIAEPTHSTSAERKNPLFIVFRYAAILVVLVGFSAFFYFWKTASKPVNPYKENIIEVPYGSKLTLTLPDKSQIWINSGSKVIYDNRFGIDHRNILIVGEVYFDVAKNPDLPFIVHAGTVNIKAVGTAFNVKAYPEENRIETTLVHGIVEVKQQGMDRQILLKPSEKIVILNKAEKNPEGIGTAEITQSKAIENSHPAQDFTNEIKIDKEINTEKEIGWKDGKLIFESEPLETLIIPLMRKYDVTFEFSSNKLKSYKFSGTFQDMTLDKILDALKFSSPISYEIVDKKVLIKEKKELKNN